MNKYFFFFALAFSAFQAHAQCPAGQDCGKPTVACHNGLSVNLAKSTKPGVVIFIQDFVKSALDSVTPSEQLQLSMRRKGTGQGFPLDSAGRPVTQLTWGCADIGTQFVEVWARDLAGNASSCETYLLVQDNLGVCGPPDPIRYPFCFSSNCAAYKMDSINVSLEAERPAGQPPITIFGPVFKQDSLGCYIYSPSLSLPIATSYLITPTKNTNPLEGVTTLDLTMIVRHILGAAPITNPYALIAADADRSGSITSRDIVVLRRLILGLDDNLPGNSWRFVRKNHVFPNPANPFSAPFPERISKEELSSNPDNKQFLAIKIGDVSCYQ